MICIFFFLQSQKKMCTFATMFEYCRKHKKTADTHARGLVRCHAPQPISTYNRLFKNGTNLKKVCAIFSENQIIKPWTLQVF